MTATEARIRAKLDRLGALLAARDPAAADELWGARGAPLIGSEGHEQYFTRDEIAVHFDEIYAKPFRLGFDWKTIWSAQAGPVIWAVAWGDLVLDHDDGRCRAMPYRLTAVFEEIDGELHWRLFSGAEPAPPPAP